MTKLIKDLPKWVQEIAIPLQKTRHGYIKLEMELFSSFIFERTNEGHLIWSQANQGNFQPLADFHGITIDEPSPKDPVSGYGGC